MSRDLLVGERRQADVLDRGNDKYKVTQEHEGKYIALAKHLASIINI